MSWETIRRRRLLLHPLRGTWQAVALTHPEEFDPTATFKAWIELDALQFSAFLRTHDALLRRMAADREERAREAIRHVGRSI